MSHLPARSRDATHRWPSIFEGRSTSEDQRRVASRLLVFSLSFWVSPANRASIQLRHRQELFERIANVRRVVDVQRIQRPAQFVPQQFDPSARRKLTADATPRTEAVFDTRVQSRAGQSYDPYIVDLQLRERSGSATGPNRAEIARFYD